MNSGKVYHIKLSFSCIVRMSVEEYQPYRLTMFIMNGASRISVATVK